jgi:hypothetical protein
VLQHCDFTFSLMQPPRESLIRILSSSSQHLRASLGILFFLHAEIRIVHGASSRRSLPQAVWNERTVDLLALTGRAAICGLLPHLARTLDVSLRAMLALAKEISSPTILTSSCTAVAVGAVVFASAAKSASRTRGSSSMCVSRARRSARSRLSSGVGRGSL